jgi:hypothetical protein
VDRLDVLEQQRVLLSASGFGPAQPVVLARARYVEDPAGHRDIDGVVGECTDQRED